MRKEEFHKYDKRAKEYAEAISEVQNLITDVR